MSSIEDQREILSRHIADIDNQIAELQAEGRDNGDRGIRSLEKTRRELKEQREILYDTAPVFREDRGDPVTGRDLQEQTQEEAVVQGFRR